MSKSHLFASLLVVALCACNEGKVYDHYEHTSLNGWEKVDTLKYNVPHLEESGKYSIDIGLRATKGYPYQSITLIMERTVFPSKEVHADTVNCKIVSPKGKVLGRGVTLNQYHLHIDETYLQKGDSLHINITHNMKREILPGISDVGIEVTRMDN